MTENDFMMLRSEITALKMAERIYKQTELTSNEDRARLQEVRRLLRQKQRALKTARKQVQPKLF